MVTQHSQGGAAFGVAHGLPDRDRLRAARGWFGRTQQKSQENDRRHRFVPRV
jgi:hypothetical protein